MNLEIREIKYEFITNEKGRNGRKRNKRVVLCNFRKIREKGRKNYRKIGKNRKKEN